MFLLIAVLAIGGCSEEDVSGQDTSGDFVEGTLSDLEDEPETTPQATTPPETTAVPGPPPETFEAVLRLEGDPQTTFSGICTVGPEESIISGQVPQRYRFDLNGESLSCRIQKQDTGGGNLRVVLLAGESTRSVQQTSSPDSVIRLSYAGG